MARIDDGRSYRSRGGAVNGGRRAFRPLRASSGGIIPIGVFAARAPGEIAGKPLYLQQHRIRSGIQTLTVMVQGQPVEAGIDPDYLLPNSDGELPNNIAGVTIKR